MFLGKLINVLKYLNNSGSLPTKTQNINSRKIGTSLLAKAEDGTAP